MEAIIGDVLALSRAGVIGTDIATQLGISLDEVTTILKASELPKRSKITKTDEEAIIQDYLKFLPLFEISKRYNASVGTIYAILNINGVERRGQPQRLSNSQYYKALSMYYRGYKTYEIEKETGVASTLLYRYIHDLDLPTWRENKKAADKYYEFLKDAGQSFISTSA